VRDKRKSLDETIRILFQIYMLSVKLITRKKNVLISPKTDTVKPVLRGHIWDKDKVAYKTGHLLKEVQFI
jgi:hypothetical protein